MWWYCQSYKYNFFSVTRYVESSKVLNGASVSISLVVQSPVTPPNVNALPSSSRTMSNLSRSDELVEELLHMADECFELVRLCSGDGVVSWT